MYYITYFEYITLGGSIVDETVFNRYLFMSEKEIDRETFNRIRGMLDVPKAVKMLVFELIEINYVNDCSKEKVSSESVGSWSKTYVKTDLQSINSIKKQLIQSYLSGLCDDNSVPLLYRGVD